MATERSSARPRVCSVHQTLGRSKGRLARHSPPHLISRLHRDPGYRGRDRMAAHGVEWRHLSILGVGRRMLLEIAVSKAQKRAEAEQG